MWYTKGNLKLMGGIFMTLQQLTMEAMDLLPESQKLQVLNFAKSLNTLQSTSERISAGKSRRKSGMLKGQVKMADDFDETPECFREYMR